MLDKRTKTLLNYIVSNCETGSYTIFSIADLIKIYSPKLKIDYVAINQMITYLVERNYLEIKHSDENCFCLSSLPKARVEYENDEYLQKNNKKIRKIAIILLILSFLFAFIGGVSGVIVSKFLF